jgi:hypothetical protein
MAPAKSPLAPSSSLPQRLEPYTEREAKIERERRRGLVFVHLRTLQRLGVVIGDPVALHVAGSDASGQAGVVVGQAWVGSNVGEDEVHIDPLMADNCGAKFGQLALLQPLDPRTLLLLQWCVRVRVRCVRVRCRVRACDVVRAAY